MPRWLLCLILGVCACVGGCDFFSSLQSLSSGADVPAAYKGLAHQNVAVMVWVSRGPATDYPDLQQELASTLHAQLVEAQADSSELKGANFMNPMSVVRFQDDHPDLDGLPVQDVAPRLGASRVVYVEVESFETRAHDAVDRFHGDMTADVSVVEVNGNDAKITYHEVGVREIYPKDKPEGVEADDGGEEVRHRTVRQFAKEVAQRFYAHPSADNDD